MHGERRTDGPPSLGADGMTDMSTITGGILSLRDLVGQFAFDFSVIDLVLWFPRMSWSEFAGSTAAVLSWCWLSNQLENSLNRRFRRLAAWLLLRLALLLRP